MKKGAAVDHALVAFSSAILFARRVWTTKFFFPLVIIISRDVSTALLCFYPDKLQFLSFLSGIEQDVLCHFL